MLSSKVLTTETPAINMTVRVVGVVVHVVCSG